MTQVKVIELVLVRDFVIATLMALLQAVSQLSRMIYRRTRRNVLMKHLPQVSLVTIVRGVCFLVPRYYRVPITFCISTYGELYGSMAKS